MKELQEKKFDQLDIIEGNNRFILKKDYSSIVVTSIYF